MIILVVCLLSCFVVISCHVSGTLIRDILLRLQSCKQIYVIRLCPLVLRHVMHKWISTVLCSSKQGGMDLCCKTTSKNNPHNCLLWLITRITKCWNKFFSDNTWIVACMCKGCRDGCFEKYRGLYDTTGIAEMSYLSISFAAIQLAWGDSQCGRPYK